MRMTVASQSPETRKEVTDPKCATAADHPAMFEGIVRTTPTVAEADQTEPVAVDVLHRGSPRPCCRIIRAHDKFDPRTSVLDDEVDAPYSDDDLLDDTARRGRTAEEALRRQGRERAAQPVKPANDAAINQPFHPSCLPFRRLVSLKRNRLT
jgi:hypothetical protein